jgi:ribosomal protein S18 acetylase RimI-like enzyme
MAQIMELSLRPAAAEDEEFLYQVYASTRAEELAQVNWDSEQKEAFLRMQFNAQAAFYRENYPAAEFQVILVDGQAAGRLYVERRAGETRIMDIALLPQHRGRGIGTTLLKEIIAEGRPVSIHVEIFNPALRLYTRLGFRKAADKGVYWLMRREPGEERKEDA